MHALFMIAVLELEHNIEYVLESDVGKVCVNCTFLDDSTDSCVVLVHEKITCETLPCEVDLINIHTSRRLTRSGSKAYGCITDINITNYQVGVVGGKIVTPLTSSNIGMLTYY